MALQVYSAVPRSSIVQSYGVAAKHLSVGGDCPQPQVMRRKERRLSLSLSVGVRSSLDASAGVEVAAVAEVGKVTAVTKDTFWPIVKAAGDKTVVVDMYTQW